MRPRMLAALLLPLLPVVAWAEAVAPKPLKLASETLESQLAQLEEAGVNYLVVEMFAPWCPVCQRFRPHFERVAARFNGPPSVPRLRLAQIDCVAQAHLCQHFHVQGFPTLRFGRPADFRGEGQGEEITGAPREAEALLQWINARLHTQWTLELPAVASDADYAAAHHQQHAYPPPPGAWEEHQAEVALPVPRADFGDAELATLEAFEHALEGGLLTAARRGDFHSWTSLLATAHPVHACREGAQALAQSFDTSWPSGEDAPAALANFAPCGRDRPRPRWGDCAGSSPDTRGYTCGLWTLFHGLAERVPSTDGAPLWYEGVRAFSRSFFTCSDCSAHFLERTAEADVASLAAGGGSKEASLWAWRVHNEVNERLAAEEAAHPGPGVDPAFPKEVWPSHELCASCGCPDEAHCLHMWKDHGPGGGLWHEDEVSLFLTSYYGPEPGEAAGKPWDAFGLQGGVPAHHQAPHHQVRHAAEALGELSHSLTAAEEDERALAAALRSRERGLEERRSQALPKFSGQGLPGEGRATGRDLDKHDITSGGVVLERAPGGLPVWFFVLLCALLPVTVYALLASCGVVGGGAGRGGSRHGSSALLACSAATNTLKPARYSPSWQLQRLLGGKKKTGLGASLAMSIGGQSLKTV